jgi:hypothetical protein
MTDYPQVLVHRLFSQPIIGNVLNLFSGIAPPCCLLAANNGHCWTSIVGDSNDRDNCAQVTLNGLPFSLCLTPQSSASLNSDRCARTSSIINDRQSLIRVGGKSLWRDGTQCITLDLEMSTSLDWIYLRHKADLSFSRGLARRG